MGKLREMVNNIFPVNLVYFLKISLKVILLENPQESADWTYAAKMPML
jgi:hypothetical protein